MVITYYNSSMQPSLITLLILSHQIDEVQYIDDAIYGRFLPARAIREVGSRTWWNRLSCWLHNLWYVLKTRILVVYPFHPFLLFLVYPFQLGGKAVVDLKKSICVNVGGVKCQVNTQYVSNQDFLEVILIPGNSVCNGCCSIHFFHLFATKIVYKE